MLNLAHEVWVLRTNNVNARQLPKAVGLSQRLSVAGD